jgi:uncharacterized protein
MKLMVRVNKIMSDPFFQECLAKTTHYEKERYFCKHGLDHSVNVARISYILALEKGKLKQIGLKLKGIDSRLLKELIYAAGILHDVARWKEYEDGSDHALVGSTMALPILQKAGFNLDEINVICKAIEEHRGGERLRTPLGEVLWLADDYSRECLECQAKDKCYKIAKMPLSQASIVY